MHTAISLKYIGLPLEAQNADYDDYIDLALVCQHCRQPVFLVNGRSVGKSKRQLKSGKKILVKGYDTEPYFAHFHSSQKECQIRSKPTSSKPPSVSTPTRNQRFKYFEAKIKQILLLNPRLANANFLESLWLRSFLRDNSDSKVNGYLRNAIAQLRSRKGLVIEKAEEIINNLTKLDKLETRLPQLNYLNNSLETQLHQQIVLEVISFLFSPSGYKIITWLYQIAATEALIIESATELIGDAPNKNPSLHNKILVQGNYIVSHDGIFSLINHNFLERNELEKVINDIVVKPSEQNLFFYSLAGLIALTPWKTGFDLAEKSLLARPRQNISSFYVASKQRGMGGYLLLDRRKKKLVFKNFPSLDLGDWMGKIKSRIRSGQHQSAVYIRQNLPQPLQQLEVIINIPKLNFSKIAIFSLLKEKKIVAQAQFWFELQDKRERKKFGKRNSELIKCELELLTKYPTAYVIDAESSQYENILLSIINCWLTT